MCSMNAAEPPSHQRDAGRPFGVEIQHLLTFLAIYEERRVTTAARRLGRTQSALSHSLSRLREIMGDELFVARAGEMWPTAEAQQVYPAIKEAVSLIHGLHERRRTFDPARDGFDLRIGMTDHAQKLLSPSIWQRIAQAGAGVRLIVHIVDRFNAEGLLLGGELDLAIVGDPLVTRSEVLCEALFSDEIVVASARAESPDPGRRTAPLDLDTYLASGHIAVARQRGGIGLVDATLRANGHVRNVRCIVPAYSQVPPVVASSQLLGTFARGVFADAGPAIVLHDPPFRIEPVRISLLHLHPSRSSSAQRWAAQLVQEASQQSLAQGSAHAPSQRRVD
ncbi:LysR family transcriptional regulator [Variovorax sp. KK3]|uniref:LysR family transcriptional regulator n=1 Tax=Variovorax sp. KK3 TaxID=1855728 RepID=UPI00097C476E|nr:LysR family transcriptional regulator [Variovorax sp. KK3]